MNTPEFVIQFDAYGSPEKIDTTIYSVKILCSDCLNVRYVRKADESQVDYCKPCARKHRLNSRARRAREGRSRKNNATD